MAQLLDATGVPIPNAEQRRARSKAMAGFNGVGFRSQSYDAAEWRTEEMSDWHPYLDGPDTANNYSRDTIVARTRDLVRNDGWASGAVTRILDGAVGADLRLVANPDYAALSVYDPGFDADWANEFRKVAEALWRSWANDPNKYGDAKRKHTMGQIFRLAFRHRLVDGELLAQLAWIPQRMGYGRAKYATAVNLIDPDRLSNPQLVLDTVYCRGGVQIDDLGASVGYHIRRAHQNEWMLGPNQYIWDYIPRETAQGRQVMVHDFDTMRDGEHRPAGGIFTPILSRMKMLAKYDSVELQAAVINAIFAAYIESPFDPNLMQDGMGDTLPQYQADRAEYGSERKIQLGGARISALFPGEKIGTVAATRPAAAFADFEGAMLRNASAALGLTYEQLSQDWSHVNYSSARAGLLEAWKTLARRRQDFAIGFASPVYVAFLEEAIDRGELPLPPGAPDFVEERAAYARCMWMGPPRGWVDPVKEAQAAVLRMDAGLSTLRQECAEQGMDYEEVIAQRGREVAEFKKLGLALPTWAGVELASDTEMKPPPQ